MKIAIALEDSIGPGFLANASACIVSGLFDKEENLLGSQIEADNFTYIPITKIPILIVKRNNKDWKELLMNLDLDSPIGSGRHTTVFKILGDYVVRIPNRIVPYLNGKISVKSIERDLDLKLRGLTNVSRRILQFKLSNPRTDRIETVEILPYLQGEPQADRQRPQA